MGTANGDYAVFDGLAERLESAVGELGKLIEEKDAPMREADLAWARHLTAADQAGVANGVVRRPEGSLANERSFRREHAGDRVDLGGLESLVDGHGGKDGRECPSQEGLTGTGGARHQHVVAAGCGYFQRSLDVLLAANVAHVDAVTDGFRMDAVRYDRLDAIEAAEVLDETNERWNSNDVDVVHQACFARVDLGHEHFF